MSKSVPSQPEISPLGSAFSPTYRAGSPEPNPAEDTTVPGSSTTYSVASHTVRITKHGYAIDPVELRYPEIIKNLPADLRRASQTSFDGTQIGYRVLSLIRGFWSQPGFPKGRPIRLTEFTSLDSILDLFKRYPTYPHRETRARMVVVAPTVNNPAKGKQGNAKGSKKNGVFKKAISSLISNKSAANAKTGENVDKSTRSQFITLSPPTTPTPYFNDLSSQSNQKAQSKPVTPKKKATIVTTNVKQKPTANKTPQITLSSDTYHTWIPRDKDQLAELIMNLCKRMETVFSKEARIISISSPCLVLGDIHGNLHDLRTYERSLWPKAPCCLSNNYLFLGDYVDRGDFSVECVLYLFSMKLISPKRFFLLRGNHEVAAIQRQYTFSTECEAKFGPIGRSLWRCFNKVFDVMPLAAIIDNKIFCAHGGIPRTITDIKALAKDIPSPLDNPEIQSPAAWEILWNDPITDSELIGMIEMDNAVVTQTVVTQVQPTPDGNELVTTTSNSTSIATTADTSRSGTPVEGGRGSNSTATDHQAASTTSATATNDPQNNALNEADAILTREPSVALSYYIRPDNQDSQQDTANKETASKQGTSVAGKANRQKDEDTLRTVPSDTSSVASTSPQEILNDGFIANIKRGTAYLFADQAINNFLKVNKLSHVIRAHEVIPTGFAFHGDGRVITIFSSSKYCGLNNQAACAFVEHNHIRILRLDTGDAGE